jgi:hypothetical protein
VCGAFVGLTILSYAYFQFYQPDTTEAKYTEEYVEKLNAQGAKLQAAKDRVTRAEERVAEIAERWRQVSTAKSARGNGFINLNQDPLSLTISAQNYRNKVQSAVNRQMKVGGVTVVNGPFLERPTNDPTTLLTSYFNVDRLPFPAVIFELGTVTVRGTFQQIERNIKGWTTMPDYFAVADGLSIVGTSPELTATYSVVIVGFLPGEVTGPLGAPVVTGAAGTAASAGTGQQGGGPRTNTPTGSGGGAQGGGKVLPGANTPTGAGG